MSEIILTDQPELNVGFSVDPDTNILTIDLLDDALISLGTIKIENIKFKTFMKALTILAESRISTLEEQARSRTEYDVQAESARITFG